MEKNLKKQASLVCFIVGLALLIAQDLEGLKTLDLGFSWPWTLMFYIGLVLMIIGYALRG